MKRADPPHPFVLALPLPPGAAFEALCQAAERSLRDPVPEGTSPRIRIRAPRVSGGPDALLVVRGGVELSGKLETTSEGSRLVGGFGPSRPARIVRLVAPFVASLVAFVVGYRAGSLAVAALSAAATAMGAILLLRVVASREVDEPDAIARWLIGTMASARLVSRPRAAGSASLVVDSPLAPEAALEALTKAAEVSLREAARDGRESAPPIGLRRNGNIVAVERGGFGMVGRIEPTSEGSCLVGEFGVPRRPGILRMVPAVLGVATVFFLQHSTGHGVLDSALPAAAVLAVGAFFVLKSRPQVDDDAPDAIAKWLSATLRATPGPGR